ncbi:MAG TPA: LLM class F420-dependent oxidoreductase [Candidatus Dormibacteraeota bacterium]|nr:LLM class F420-dependent oxidoreductase [Candidatus Dormibacteraeota bacterium]
MEIGPIGIWTQWTPWANATMRAAELEELGFSALWLGASPPGDLRLAESLIAASQRLIVGTSIVNIWDAGASLVAESYHRIAGEHPGRFVLGLGVSHAPVVGEAYRRPLRKLSEYLDELDAATPPVPVDGRAIASLGPRSLEIAGSRSLGTLPYLTTPEHTRSAREILGPDALLAPEQKVVLESDPSAARAIARRRLAMYLTLPNYVNNWRRLGFEEADFEQGGSDRLVDAVVAWGTPDAIRARLQEHLDAGADHVAVQVLVEDVTQLPFDQFRALAQIVHGVTASR